jgi:hypothetical protein
LFLILFFTLILSSGVNTWGRCPQRVPRRWSPGGVLRGRAGLPVGLVLAALRAGAVNGRRCDQLAEVLLAGGCPGSRAPATPGATRHP